MLLPIKIIFKTSTLSGEKLKSTTDEKVFRTFGVVVGGAST